jgi:hypothetical protein
MLISHQITHRNTSKLHRDIAREFVIYLQSLSSFPRGYNFLPSLADYEYAEILVDLAEDDDFSYVDIDGDILNAKPYITGASYLGVYDYPVNDLSEDYIVTDKLDSPICLLVYRNRDDEVKFFQLNELSAALLEMLELNEVASGGEAIELLAHHTGNRHDDEFLQTGMDTLKKFYTSGVILGTWHNF